MIFFLAVILFYEMNAVKCTYLVNFVYRGIQVPYNKEEYVYQ